MCKCFFDNMLKQLFFAYSCPLYALNLMLGFSLYVDKKQAQSDTVRMLMEQKMAEKQAEAEQELMAGVTEKGLKAQ